MLRSYSQPVTIKHSVELCGRIKRVIISKFTTVALQLVNKFNQTNA